MCEPAGGPPSCPGSWVLSHVSCQSARTRAYTSSASAQRGIQSGIAGLVSNILDCSVPPLPTDRPDSTRSLAGPWPAQPACQYSQHSMYTTPGTSHAWQEAAHQALACLDSMLDCSRGAGVPKGLGLLKALLLQTAGMGMRTIMVSLDQAGSASAVHQQLLAFKQDAAWISAPRPVHCQDGCCWPHVGFESVA